MFSLCIFVFSNVGLAIYKHSCSISGTEISFFIEGEDPCASEHAPIVSTCCEKSALVVEECHQDELEKQHVHEQKSCCSTDADYLTLNIDTTVQSPQIDIESVNFPAIITPNFAFFLGQTITLNEVVEHAFGNLPPPKFYGRDYQSILQVYTI